MLEMLDAFDCICRKHSINYWLACGTLLGARRHGGFIPWDDDLDVVVLQTDYKKLLSVLKEDLPENFKLQARGTDRKHWFYYARLRDTNSRIYGKKPDSYDYKGIFIDIFFIEPVPSMLFKKTIDKFLISEIRVIRAKSLYHKIKYGVMFGFIPIIRFTVMLIRMYYKYLGNTKVYTYSFGTFFYPTYNIEHFYPVSEITFEGKKYRAPGNVDKYLVENFDSNFMIIPKPKDRLKHALEIDFY
jgi:lipopolysaccharide cholinephosphotransferase